MKKLTLFLILTTLVLGCASLPNQRTAQIDNRRVDFALTRNGAPTVVFENGLGATMNWWAEVFPEVAKHSSAFAYNRPGYGNSDPPTTPRDGQQIVDELRALLQSQDLQPPYILVGHSLGGLYMQLFARRYPDEVRALLLVDSTHPNQLKGAGSVENWPVWLQILFNVMTSDVEQNELNAINVTGEQVLQLPTLTGKSVVVLSALQPLEESSTLADDTNQKRRDIARLYPNSQQIWVDSGHAIPLEQPEAIISAIRTILLNSL